MNEKQYSILDAHGRACATVWGFSVQPKTEGDPGFWIKDASGSIIVSAWFGYKEAEGQDIFVPGFPIEHGA